MIVVSGEGGIINVSWGVDIFKMHTLMTTVARMREEISRSARKVSMACWSYMMKWWSLKELVKIQCSSILRVLPQPMSAGWHNSKFDSRGDHIVLQRSFFSDVPTGDICFFLMRRHAQFILLTCTCNLCYYSGSYYSLCISVASTTHCHSFFSFLKRLFWYHAAFCAAMYRLL